MISCLYTIKITNLLLCKPINQLHVRFTQGHVSKIILALGKQSCNALTKEGCKSLTKVASNNTNTFSSNISNITDNNSQNNTNTSSTNNTLYNLGSKALKCSFNLIPTVYPPNINPIPIEASCNSIQSLLIEAEKRKLILYEDTHEYPQSGSVKLTPLGINYYHLIGIKPIIHDISNLDPNATINYFVGSLAIHNDALIPFSKQLHLIVVFDIKNNQYMAFGSLTSEKSTEHFKLSETQPISNNNKAQYLKIFPVALIVIYNEFEVHQKGTEYVKDMNIKTKLDFVLKNIKMSSIFQQELLQAI